MIQGFIDISLGVLLNYLAFQRPTTLKFSLPNVLQNSYNPTTFLGSQYVSPKLEVNLPLSLDQLNCLNSSITRALICGMLDWLLVGQHLREHMGEYVSNQQELRSVHLS